MSRKISKKTEWIPAHLGAPGVSKGWTGGGGPCLQGEGELLAADLPYDLDVRIHGSMFKAVACAIGGIPLHEWNFLLGDLLISGEHPVINGSPLLQNEFWSTLTRLALRSANDYRLGPSSLGCGIPCTYKRVCYICATMGTPKDGIEELGSYTTPWRNVEQWPTACLTEYRSKRHLHHRRQVILPVDFRPLKDMLLSAAVHMALRKVLQDLENEL
ncbi:hypothetical protein QR680_007628 [Steinernema hermaphroditum]|uniref:Uncharacterized protein n=1 Tax=Steinernema hermaphroditum TaxID=289476 RepID=A0AA39IG71_9BILA|nr:hypothetical protein QR680_007628 [Steinernema hermaphroditum]